MTPWVRRYVDLLTIANSATGEELVEVDRKARSLVLGMTEEEYREAATELARYKDPPGCLGGWNGRHAVSGGEPDWLKDVWCSEANDVHRYEDGKCVICGDEDAAGCLLRDRELMEDFGLVER